MKLFYLLLLTFSAITCLAQRTYTVANAQLAFIHPEEGIIVKQGEAYSRFTVNVSVYQDEVKYKPEFEKLTAEKFEALHKDPGNIYPKGIKALNLKKLPETAFLYKNKHGYEAVRYVNGDYFAEMDEEGGKGFLKGVSGYFYVRFGNKTLIMLRGDVNGLIINTENGLRFLKEWGKEIYTAVKNNYRFTEQDILNFHIEEKYIADTLKARVGLRNVFKEVVIPHRYDSIVQSHYFIACYKGKDIDLYNHMLQKLDLPGLRAFIPADYYIQEAKILQGNTPKRLMVTGQELKELRVYTLDEMPNGEETVTAEIVKKEGVFYLKSPEWNDFLQEMEVQLHKTDGIDSLYLPDNELKLSFGMINYHTVVCCKLTNGKYSIRYLDDMVHIRQEGDTFTRRTIENMDRVYFNYGRLLFEHDGLTGIWLLNTQPRYKTLDGFTNGFARFTFPNGKKGWLSREGKEYLDE